MRLPGHYYSYVTYILFPLSLISTNVRGNPDWSYTDQSTWANTWPKCGGQKQSPINLQTKDVTYDGSLKNINFLYRNQTSVKLSNNGKTIRANVLSLEFLISGADLGNKFRLVEFHFHWGSTNTQGSEHQINGRKFPLEMHLVHYNSDKYSNESVAKLQPDGLAVISVLFELSSDENLMFNQIIDYFQNVSSKGDEIIVQEVSVSDILPSDTTRYYRYNGSLTKPGCYESVKWIILKQTAKISQEQLNKFRSVYAIATSKQSTKPEKKLVDNFRSVQPLNKRTVRKNFDEPPFPCGKRTSLTADCRHMTEGKEVFYEIEVHACTLPVSVTIKLSIPGLFDTTRTGSEDIRTPIQIGSLDHGVTMEMHYHADGKNAGKIHITVYQAPLSAFDANKIKVVEEYFTVAGVCPAANCSVEKWDKHWCTATIGYANDTLDLGFSSILFEQCSPSSPSMRVKVYRQEERWVWAAEKTFKNNDIQDIGLTGSIVQGAKMEKRSSSNTRWSTVTFEAFIKHVQGTNIDFTLYMVKGDIGGRFLILKDRYTYPQSICNFKGKTSASRKVAIGVSVGLVVVVMIAITLWVMYRKRQQFFGHQPTLVDEIDVQDADQL